MKKKFQNRIIGHGTEDPEQLLANPRNWRIHPKMQQDALQGVLEEVGWVDDIIVNQNTGFVVDGHLRVSLAITNEEETIPVKYVNLTEDEEVLVLATIDPIAAMAATDKELLSEVLEGIQSDNEQVLKALDDIAKAENINLVVEEDPGAQMDRADELQEKWRVERGQVWQIGDHRLMCGDSISEEDSQLLIGEENIGAVITDPPYGLGNKKNFNEDYPDYDDEEPFNLELIDICAPFVIWGGNYYDWLPEPRNKIGWIVWDKRPNLDGEKRERADRRFGQHFEIAITTVSELRGKMMRHRWGGYYGSEEILHKTQKPVELLVECIRATRSSIVDWFLGSGTTMVAAQQLNRICYGMEIEPKYCAVALERMSEMGLEPKLV